MVDTYGAVREPVSRGTSYEPWLAPWESGRVRSREVCSVAVLPRFHELSRVVHTYPITPPVAVRQRYRVVIQPLIGVVQRERRRPALEVCPRCITARSGLHY